MTPTQEYRRISLRRPPPLPKGADALVHRAIGAYRRRSAVLRQLAGQAEAIDRLAPQFTNLTDPQLQERLRESRSRFRRGGRGLEAGLDPAIAALREASHRQTGLRPFPVQLMAVLALYRGLLAEMATGEGKTLTASLAAILWGWQGQPCHVITVNDYLVRRDAEWFAPLYRFCGIRVGHVTGGMTPAERREHYQCDVTYATSKEVVADFLRDCLQTGPLRDPTRRMIRQTVHPPGREQPGVVMRGLHSAIVDEADSVLIDEAVTPLIISAPRDNRILQEAVLTACEIAAPLVPGTDYDVNPRYREIRLTETGAARLAERCQQLPGLWQGPLRRFELVRQALVAREFFHRDGQYIVDDAKLVIVDEFTGRQMPQRSWRAGLHQAIEAKEGLVLTDPTDTLARLSFQRYFRLYHRLAGMTGTAREAAAEFWHVYRLPVVTIPPNRPCIRGERPDRIFATQTEKWTALAADVSAIHASGRPLLIGTRSVAVSEMLGERLAQAGLPCHVLNAVRHQEEAAIIATAGDRGRITIATNMAGRGTDIRLAAGVATLGGLHVIATERHESRRVDRQLFGRTARQGDPGSAQAFVSLEDDLLRDHLPASVRRACFAAVRHAPALGRSAVSPLIARAQKRAQRLAATSRQKLLRIDDWLEEALSFSNPGTA